MFFPSQRKILSLRLPRRNLLGIYPLLDVGDYGSLFVPLLPVSDVLSALPEGDSRVEFDEPRILLGDKVDSVPVPLRRLVVGDIFSRAGVSDRLFISDRELAFCVDSADVRSLDHLSSDYDLGVALEEGCFELFGCIS